MFVDILENYLNSSVLFLNSTIDKIECSGINLLIMIRLIRF
jgi:hypothetical protein